MSALKSLYQSFVKHMLIFMFSFVSLFFFAWNYLKNPFSNPWAQKLRLVPPACLTDPKYGTHKYIKVNGIKLHYVESGDPSKSLMLFLHGFPEFWYSWRHQIVEFNKDYWCIAVDSRGFGDSEKPEKVSSYNIEVLVEDIRDLIRQLGREKAILITHDWGGIVACKFRDTYPEATMALVMLSGTTGEAWAYQINHSWRQLLASWYIFFFQIPVLPELFLQMNDMDTFNKMLPIKGNNITDNDIECFKYWFGKPAAFTPAINYYRANMQLIMEKKYKEEKVPMLAAGASNDKYLTPEILDSMKTEYAHIETTMIEGCGHFMQQEAPDKVKKLIRDFLNKYSIV